ncbi:hypothetical protein GQ457_02G019040 [Hibiscus cannabinus]
MLQYLFAYHPSLNAAASLPSQSLSKGHVKKDSSRFPRPLIGPQTSILTFFYWRTRHRIRGYRIIVSFACGDNDPNKAISLHTLV